MERTIIEITLFVLGIWIHFWQLKRAYERANNRIRGNNIIWNERLSEAQAMQEKKHKEDILNAVSDQTNRFRESINHSPNGLKARVNECILECKSIGGIERTQIAKEVCDKCFEE